MEEIVCIYCDFPFTEFSKIITHYTSQHKDRNLKIKICKYSNNKLVSTHSKDFRVIPIELKSSAIVPNNETKIIKSKLEHLSPLK